MSSDDDSDAPVFEDVIIGEGVAPDAADLARDPQTDAGWQKQAGGWQFDSELESALQVIVLQCYA
jgi:hypothetical protein